MIKVIDRFATALNLNRRTLRYHVKTFFAGLLFMLILISGLWLVELFTYAP